MFVTNGAFVKVCFAIPLGNKYAFEAELLIVIYALKVAQKYSWDMLWLECDSMYLVHLLSYRSLNVPWFARKH